VYQGLEFLAFQRPFDRGPEDVPERFSFCVLKGQRVVRIGAEGQGSAVQLPLEDRRRTHVLRTRDPGRVQCGRCSGCPHDDDLHATPSVIDHGIGPQMPKEICDMLAVEVDRHHAIGRRCSRINRPAQQFGVGAVES